MDKYANLVDLLSSSFVKEELGVVSTVFRKKDESLIINAYGSDVNVFANFCHYWGHG